MSTHGNTALKNPSLIEEPSMDEIMASIRQIIAEDEDGEGDRRARANYTHPDNPSNSNAVAPSAGGSDFSASLSDELETALQQQIDQALAEDLAAEISAPVVGQTQAGANGSQAAPAVSAIAPTGPNGHTSHTPERKSVSSLPI